MKLTLVILTGLSFVLTLWRWLAATVYLRGKERGQSGQGGHSGNSQITCASNITGAGRMPAPPCTVLKPVKGAEADTRKCLHSWLSQNYPGKIQILFGVASPEDPVCAVIRDLLAEFPGVDARLIVCPEALAPNRKVSTLMQLEPHICHEIVVISDADVSVPADFLERAVKPFVSPDVGLVHSFYRLANPSTLAMQWEAIGVNADFWSEVLQSRSLKEVDFALGATMILPRRVLSQIGGFATLSTYLADDYQLGRKVAELGLKIVFSPMVVDCWESSQNFKQVWAHQLRWARTIRVCQPAPYFFSILNNSSIWPFLLLVCSGAEFPFAPYFALACLIFRIGTALELQARHTGSMSALAYWWMVPIKDLLNVTIWAGSFLGNQITWRGDRYRVLPGGKLAKLG